MLDFESFCQAVQQAPSVLLLHTYAKERDAAMAHRSASDPSASKAGDSTPHDVGISSGNHEGDGGTHDAPRKDNHGGPASNVSLVKFGGVTIALEDDTASSRRVADGGGRTSLSRSRPPASLAVASGTAGAGVSPRQGSALPSTAGVNNVGGAAGTSMPMSTPGAQLSGVGGASVSNTVAGAGATADQALNWSTDSANATSYDGILSGSGGSVASGAGGVGASTALGGSSSSGAVGAHGGFSSSATSVGSNSTLLLAGSLKTRNARVERLVVDELDPNASGAIPTQPSGSHSQSSNGLLLTASRSTGTFRQSPSTGGITHQGQNPASGTMTPASDVAASSRQGSTSFTPSPVINLAETPGAAGAPVAVAATAGGVEGYVIHAGSRRSTPAGGGSGGGARAGRGSRASQNLESSPAGMSDTTSLNASPESGSADVPQPNVPQPTLTIERARDDVAVAPLLPTAAVIDTGGASPRPSPTMIIPQLTGRLLEASPRQTMLGGSFSYGDFSESDAELRNFGTMSMSTGGLVYNKQQSGTHQPLTADSTSATMAAVSTRRPSHESSRFSGPLSAVSPVNGPEQQATPLVAGQARMARAMRPYDDDATRHGLLAVQLSHVGVSRAGAVRSLVQVAQPPRLVVVSADDADVAVLTVGSDDGPSTMASPAADRGQPAQPSTPRGPSAGRPSPQPSTPISTTNGAQSPARFPWTPHPHEKIVQLFYGDKPPRHCAASADGKVLAVAHTNGAVHRYDLSSGRPLPALLHASAVNAVAFGPSGRMLVTATEEGPCFVWSTRQGVATVSTVFAGHEEPATCVACSPQSDNVAASGSADGTVRLWSAATAKQLGQVEHASAVLSVAFDAAAQLVVSCSAEAVVVSSAVNAVVLLEIAATSDLFQQPPSPNAASVKAAPPLFFTMAALVALRSPDDNDTGGKHTLTEDNMRTEHQLLVVGTSDQLVRVLSLTVVHGRQPPTALLLAHRLAPQPDAPVRVATGCTAGRELWFERLRAAPTTISAVSENHATHEAESFRDDVRRLRFFVGDAGGNAYALSMTVRDA
jgi:WD40 repeat protein